MIHFSPSVSVLIWIVTVLATTLPLLLALTRRSRKRWQRIAVACLVIMSVAFIIVSGSRAGIVAALVGALILGFPSLRHRAPAKVLYPMIILAFVAIIWGLYCIRPQSVQGRLLVYRVLVDAISQEPLWGYGWNAMNVHYMFHQASFLAQHPDPALMMLADNVYYPYNEFFGLAYRYGILPLAAVVLLIYYIWRKSTPLYRAMLAGFITMCMFSYPISAINLQREKAEELYAAAADWNLSGQYDTSDDMLRSCQKILNTYDTELLAADNALQSAQYQRAIPHLEMAHNMIPNRFYPLYGLMLCYQHSDLQKALDMAHEIVAKDIKVPSADIDMIVTEANQYIKESCIAD